MVDWEAAATAAAMSIVVEMAALVVDFYLLLLPWMMVAEAPAPSTSACVE